MKKIITILLAVGYISAYSQDYIVRTNVPNSYPFQINCDSVYIFGDGGLVLARKGNAYQVIELAYNKETKAYRLEGSAIMSKRDAKNLVKEFQNEIQNRKNANDRYLNRIRRDSLALKGIQQFFARDSTSSPGSGG